jgi:glycosyltransferase involved in cell wall biosynthesis
MKIGIDAKWLFQGPPSGSRVVRNFVKSLTSLAGEDELHLFLDRRARSQPAPAGIPPERCHYVWARNNQLANVFVVPRAADRIGLDAVVYQNFSPPTAAKHVRIAFVYDVIFESHPTFFTRQERLYFMPLRYLASRADRVCTLSKSERTRLVNFRYATAERIDVVPIAVDDAVAGIDSLPADTTHHLLAQLGVQGQFVLYAGRLNARKNVASLVRAMAHIKNAALSLIIVGAPDGTSVDLHAVAAAAGVSDRVRLLGSVSDAELRVLYAAATVFCFPSLDEGFGLCPLEAMASGTPTVVSNRPAIVETCGDAAVYIDPTDPVAIAAAIDALVGDTGRINALRIAGLERARSFSWDRSATLLLDSVHSAVEQARGNPA